MDTDLTASQGIDRETLRRLSRRSNARGFAQLGVHGLILCATGSLARSNQPCLIQVETGTRRS